MALILHIRQLCNSATILFITIITNTYIWSIITKLRAIFGVTMNSSYVPFSLPISSGFYSMNILQCKDKRFIIILITYRLFYHIQLYIISTPWLSCITSKDPTSITLYDDQSLSFHIITIVVKELCCISMFWCSI